jgi:hypothetical protein
MSLREQAAREAFVYGVPTVALYGALHGLVLAPARPGRAAGFNRLSTGTLPAGLAGVAGPAAPGSAQFHGWIDLRSGPVVLTARPPGPGGSASSTVLDMYAEEVGQVPSGPGSSARSLVLAGPSWEPTVPAEVADEVAAVHRCQTDLCLAVGHVTPEEPDGALGILPPVLVEPLDQEPVRLPLPAPVPPVDLRLPPTVGFLVALDWMLPLMPTPPGEDELRAELETIGLGCGSDALADALAEDRLDGQLTEGLRRGWDLVRRGRPHEAPTDRSALREHHVARAVRTLAAVLQGAGEDGAGSRRRTSRVTLTGHGRRSASSARDPRGPAR